MANRKQLECRVVITNDDERGKFRLGMFDPLNERYEPLGEHKMTDKDMVVPPLVTKITREGHRVSFSEISAPR